MINFQQILHFTFQVKNLYRRIRLWHRRIFERRECRYIKDIIFGKDIFLIRIINISKNFQLLEILS